MDHPNDPSEWDDGYELPLDDATDTEEGQMPLPLDELFN